MKRLFIIVGWYLDNDDFYSKVLEIRKKYNVDLFVASHKNELPEGRSNYFKINNIEIQFFPNEGYDWGAFSQAVSFLKDRLLEYDYIYFMHDDLIIKDLTFPEAFEKKLEEENLLILGNSINSVNAPFKKTHPYIFEWAKRSKWKVDVKSERWSTARGSFLLTKSKVFEKVKEIPYKTGSMVGFGNWSLRVFYGIVTDYFGPNKIATFSKNYLTSKYLDEYERGRKSEKSDEEVQEHYSKPEPEMDLMLNLYCGYDYALGYFNIDDTNNSYADYVGNLEDLDYEDNSIGEIVVSNYGKLFQNKSFDLKKLYNWLQPEKYLKVKLNNNKNPLMRVVLMTTQRFMINRFILLGFEECESRDNYLVFRKK